MYILLAVILFGLLWGSFLSVVKNRLDNLGTVLVGRSRCSKCKKTLGPLDLIPLVSFVSSWGRCRYCKKKISFEYPALEIVTAILAVLVVWQFGLNLASVILFLSISLLIVASFADISFKEVDLWIFVSGIVLAIVWRILLQSNLDGLRDIVFSAVAAATIPFLMYIISRERWMGLGDCFFALWAGILAGYPAALIAIFSAFLLGGIYGIILLVVKGKKTERKIAFGPFLGLGGAIGLFLGIQIIDYYLKIIGL